MSKPMLPCSILLVLQHSVGTFIRIESSHGQRYIEYQSWVEVHRVTFIRVCLTPKWRCPTTSIEIAWGHHLGGVVVLPCSRSEDAPHAISLRS